MQTGRKLPLIVGGFVLMSCVAWLLVRERKHSDSIAVPGARVDVTEVGASPKLSVTPGGEQRSSASSEREITGHVPVVTPDVPPGEVEPWRQMRLTELDRVLSEFKVVAESGHDSLMKLQELLVLIVAPILDERGMYEDPPPGTMVTHKPVPNEYSFNFRGREYRVQRGSFFAYDQMMDMWAAQSKTAPDPSKMLGGASRTPIVVSPELIADLENLEQEAIRAISRRTKPY